MTESGDRIEEGRAKVSVRVYLEPDAADRLRAISLLLDRPQSEIMREAFDTWVREFEASIPERRRWEATRRWVVEGGPKPEHVT